MVTQVEKCLIEESQKKIKTKQNKQTKNKTKKRNELK